MRGKTVRGAAIAERRLYTERSACAECGQRMRVDYTSSRKVAMLGCLVRLKGSIRRCENPACGRYHHPYHPEEEGRLVLPHYEYGLDVLAFIGARRYQESASAPVEGVVSDGQHSIRNAVAQVFPGVPHQLCHFHSLKQAAGPAWEADRHARKELKQRVRGIRPLERALEGRDDEEARVVQGYCAAVRGALADDGKSPLEPAGLRLHERLEAIDASLERAGQKRGACRSHSSGCRTSCTTPWRPPSGCGPA